MVHLIYNGENQLVKVDGGQGKYIQIDYEQDKIKTITDSIGRTIIYSYNDNNLLQKAIDPSGAFTEYTYEENRIKTITDRNGNIILENDYDNVGRVIKQVDGNGGVINYGYNIQKKENYYHNIKTGEKITYQYNNKFYITKKIFEDGTYEEYTYDAKGNKTSVRNRNGNVSRFVYDERNNITKTISPLPFNYETKMFYNDNDKLIEIELPNGVKQTFTYDDKGNILTVSKQIDDNHIAITSYTYDHYGRKNISDQSNRQFSQI